MQSPYLYCVYLIVRASYIDLYTIGCTIEPPVVWYIKKCMLIWKIVFILVLSLRSVYQKKRQTMLRAIDSLKRSSCAGQFSTRAILSHTMTGNRQKVVERV